MPGECEEAAAPRCSDGLEDHAVRLAPDEDFTLPLEPILLRQANCLATAVLEELRSLLAPGHKQSIYIRRYTVKTF